MIWKFQTYLYWKVLFRKILRLALSAWQGRLQELISILQVLNKRGEYGQVNLPYVLLTLLFKSLFVQTFCSMRSASAKMLSNVVLEITVCSVVPECSLLIPFFVFHFQFKIVKFRYLVYILYKSSHTGVN